MLVRPAHRKSWHLPLVVALLALGALSAPVTVGAVEYRDCSGLEPGPGVRMHRCSLPGLVIIGADLHGIDFSWSDLSGVVAGCDPDLPRTNLAGARIARAILANGQLCDAILTDADLHGTDFSGAAFEDATVDGANLSWARLDDAGAAFAPFRGVNLSNASWRDGSLIGALFDDSDLHRIDLRGSDARAASFVGADLRYARLDGANLTDADLTGAVWGRATGLDTATFSNTTCPDGTNSDANGGTCIGH